MSDNNWIVMSACDPLKNNGRSFTTNATGLSEEAAKVEAGRRNAVEKAAGHKGIDWYPCEDPFAVMKRMGLKF